MKEKALETFLKISSIPAENEIYGILSKYEPDQFSYFVFELLNDLCPTRKKGSKSIIIDSADINLNLNFMQKRLTKKVWKKKEYKWGHSTHIGFFIGMKLTLALESDTLKPLAFLINEANASETKIYPEILKELKRKNIIKAGDIVYSDRGYYSYENYVISVKEFKVVPLIFPGKNCNFKKLFNMLRSPLKIFDSSSVQKYCSLAVLLVRMTVNYGIRERKELQAFSEWGS